MAEELIQICGRITGIKFQNRENGYAIFTMRDGNGDSITAVGYLPSAVAGEELVLTGRWVSHRTYGRQFQFSSFERHMPSGTNAVYEYLASRAIKGIGPRLARLIVDAFGADSLNIIENDPKKLSKIKGISLQRAMEISESFRRQAGLRAVVEFTSSYGLQPQLAIRLYRHYGNSAIDVLRYNPYVIVGESFGASFSDADAFAINLGFDLDCPERIEAAIIFELDHNMNNGHVFLPFNKLAASASTFIGVDESEIEDGILSLIDRDIIARQTLAGTDACYLRSMFNSENYVAKRILSMALYHPNGNTDPERVLRDVEREQGIKYDERQKEAVRAALESSVIVLTGGPGTGKTTCVRGILAVYDRLGLNTALAAPTGRAAKRMSELCGREAYTIHRLLGAGYSGDGTASEFEKCSSDPLEVNAVILDEASMIDITLMDALLHAMRPECRLVMVGDVDQLPSVGPGNVFSDIIRSGTVPIIRLENIFRQAGESRIIESAHLINHGQIPDLRKNSGDFFFLRRNTPEHIAATVTELCAVRLPRNLGIPTDQIQVLTPSHKGAAGTVNLNQLIQEAVNPHDSRKNEKKHGSFIFRQGDRVMQIKNNYDIIWQRQNGGPRGSGIFNGDIGYITDIDIRDETFTINYDGRLAFYSFDMFGEIEPAYAMTVHKSQGSEYRAVILSVFNSAPVLMTRSVLYTAVTRAKEILIVVGDDGAFIKMTENNKIQKRYSGLKSRLCDGDLIRFI